MTRRQQRLLKRLPVLGLATVAENLFSGLGEDSASPSAAPAKVAVGKSGATAKKTKK